MTATGPRALDVCAEIEDLPSHESRRLLAAASGLSPSDIYAGRRVTPDQVARFDALVARRRLGEPLQYLEGSCDFGPLTLRCDERALIPRPETEQLWELVVGRFETPPDVVVDVGTGSGNLALACKHVWPHAEVYGTDSSADALALAAENVALTGLDVTVLRGDVLAPLPDRLRSKVDCILSNPPYLAAAELPSLPTEVRDHEPHAALVAGRDGTEVLAQLAAEAATWLRPEGLIACEISEFRTGDVLALFAEFDPEIVTDLAGKDRFVVGRYPAASLPSDVSQPARGEG